MDEGYVGEENIGSTDDGDLSVHEHPVLGPLLRHATNPCSVDWPAQWWSPPRKKGRNRSVDAKMDNTGRQMSAT